jgi:hypothetical protein
MTALPAPPADARMLLSVEEALRLAFPDAAIERESVFLTEEELAAATADAGAAISRALVVRYLARRDDAVVGTAYLDVHVVRTLDETLFVVVDPGGEIVRVEVLSFAEPPDYMPRRGWYEQFSGRGLDDELRLERGIRAVGGATLTAVATTAAARRVLAVHRTIEARGRTP